MEETTKCKHEWIISEWRFDNGQNMSNTYESYSPQYKTANKVICKHCLTEKNLTD